VKWVHRNKIIHRDIHDGYILIDKAKKQVIDSESFIADLGLSRPANEEPEGSELIIYWIMDYTICCTR
ncbi:7539_t:CDS:1, partial [Gigaspora rosea]